MNLIRKAIEDIKVTIPIEVLKMAYEEDFNQFEYFQRTSRSIDDLIIERTIRGRVIVDANIVGGDTIIIPVVNLPPEQLDDNNLLYHIPSSLVNNRTILSVLSADYFKMNSLPGNPYNGVPSVTPNTGSELTMSGHRAVDSRSSIPIVGTYECIVVGHNNIMVRNHLRGAIIQQFRVVVGNDKDLSNISFRDALDFSKLCTFAVKSFIHNKLIIKLDRGYIDRGHEIGAIKTYVEGLSDAEDNYRTFLEEVWQGVAAHSDRLAFEDLIKLQIDPSI